MAAVEPAVQLREVAALVGPTALGACERALCDQTHERVRVGGQRPQPVAVAFQSGVTP